MNPDRRRADRLLLAYDGEEIEVAAPTESELDELEVLLRSRRGAAHEAVSHHPPEARPAPQNCRYCGVRQLCGEYWTTGMQRRMSQEGEDRRFGDVEVTVKGSPRTVELGRLRRTVAKRPCRKARGDQDERRSRTPFR